jgi:hypothetical protein
MLARSSVADHRLEMQTRLAHPFEIGQALFQAALQELREHLGVADHVVERGTQLVAHRAEEHRLARLASSASSRARERGRDVVEDGHRELADSRPDQLDRPADAVPAHDLHLGYRWNRQLEERLSEKLPRRRIHVIDAALGVSHDDPRRQTLQNPEQIALLHQPSSKRDGCFTGFSLAARGASRSRGSPLGRHVLAHERVLGSRSEAARIALVGDAGRAKGLILRNDGHAVVDERDRGVRRGREDREGALDAALLRHALRGEPGRAKSSPCGLRKSTGWLRFPSPPLEKPSAGTSTRRFSRPCGTPASRTRSPTGH